MGLGIREGAEDQPPKGQEEPRGQEVQRSVAFTGSEGFLVLPRSDTPPAVHLAGMLCEYAGVSPECAHVSVSVDVALGLDVHL